jgi:ubiquinone/menaquinone biosynthesis C-methylase UbiE
LYPRASNPESVYGLNYVVCPNCEIAYLNPMPEQHELNEFYKQFEAFAIENPADFRMDPFRGKTIRRLRLPKENEKILDVGCGKGEVVYCLMKQGYDAVGVEPFFKPQYEIEELNRRIISRTISDAAFPDNHFSLITMWSVLEHITDPAPLLDEAARVLKPGGHLIISVPNLNTGQHKLLKGCWLGFGPPGHVFVYTESGLKKIMKERGFRLSKSLRDPVNDRWIMKNSIYTYLIVYANRKSEIRQTSKNFSKTERSLISIFSSAYVGLEALAGRKSTANLIFEKIQ